MEQSTRIPLGRFKGSYTHGGKEVQPHRSLTSTTSWSTSTGNIIKKQTTGPTLELREEEPLISIGKTPQKHGKRYVVSGMESFKDDGRSGCGIVIKGVDREKWSKIAVPLIVGAAMAAEVIGVCVLTSVLDLILCKSLSVQNINQRINRMLLC